MKSSTTRLQKIVIVLAASISMCALGTAAVLGEDIKIGVLRCDQVEGSGVNLLIHSVTDVRCTLTTSGGVEHYIGETGVGLGIDLQWRHRKALAFAVLGTEGSFKRGTHALSGKYIGAEASLAAGIGTGVRNLIGAGKSHFTLQPLVFEDVVGLGATLGVGYLYLEPGRD